MRAPVYATRALLADSGVRPDAVAVASAKEVFVNAVIGVPAIFPVATYATESLLKNAINVKLQGSRGVPHDRRMMPVAIVFGGRAHHRDVSIIPKET